MKDRYFSVEVKPTIAASLQHAAAFSVGDALFDWVEFEVPKGTSRLIGATMITRPKGNSNATGNKFGSFLVFSKTNTISYGVVNGAPNNTPSNDYLGFLELEDTTSFTLGAGTNIGMSGRASNTSLAANLLLTGSQTGSNVGYDKLYMAAQANGAFDFTSVIAIAEDTSADAAASQVITTDGSVDESEVLAVGDVLHIGTTVGTPAADSLIGTVAAVADNLVTLEAVSPTDLVDGDILYNINPIRVILHFEK
tara:strand:- start:37 stop:792 length:756 start_codon:yes stop_codon:yes gene_type:complete